MVVKQRSETAASLRVESINIDTDRIWKQKMGCTRQRYHTTREERKNIVKFYAACTLQFDVSWQL